MNRLNIKRLTHTGLILFVLISFNACVQNDEPKKELPEAIVEMIDVGGYELEVISRGKGDHTIILESGLDETYDTWIEPGIFDSLAQYYKVIAYNRAGYGKSDRGPVPRVPMQVFNDLKSIIDSKSNNEQVFLVGHSMGGAYVRATAIQYPEQVAGIVLIDPSHEDPNDEEPIPYEEIDYWVTQQVQHGAKDEVTVINEVVEFMRGLENLPDQPTVVLTARNTEHFSHMLPLHESLGQGVSPENFIHEIVDTGHFIHVEDPVYTINVIRSLVN